MYKGEVNMHELGNADAHITIEVSPGSLWNIHPTFAYGLHVLEEGEVMVQGISRYREVPAQFQQLFTDIAFTNERDSVWVRYHYTDSPHFTYYLPTKAFIGCTTHK